MSVVHIGYAMLLVPMVVYVSWLFAVLIVSVADAYFGRDRNWQQRACAATAVGYTSVAVALMVFGK